MPDKNSVKRKKIDSDVIDKAYSFTVDLLRNQLPDAFLFHNTKHMQEVLEYSELIGKYHQLNEDDLNILKISAIFHDTGYIKRYKGHEGEGAKIARKFLINNQIEENQIKKVENTIQSTKVPQKPNDLVSKILCDADLINLTYDYYFESAELMRQEWFNTGHAQLSESEFHNNSLNFFNSHHFHTEYGIKLLSPKKELNYKRIKKRLEEIEGNQ